MAHEFGVNNSLELEVVSETTGEIEISIEGIGEEYRQQARLRLDDIRRLRNLLNQILEKHHAS